MGLLVWFKDLIYDEKKNVDFTFASKCCCFLNSEGMIT
jgi:hypothetical protein